MVGSCEHGNEYSESMKLLDYMRNYYNWLYSSINLKEKNTFEMYSISQTYIFIRLGQ